MYSNVRGDHDSVGYKSLPPCSIPGYTRLIIERDTYKRDSKPQYFATVVKSLWNHNQKHTFDI